MKDMIAADLLKLRRRRGLWYTLLALPAGVIAVIGILGAAITSLKVDGGAQFADNETTAINLVMITMAAIVGARLGSDEHTLQTFRYQVLSGRPRLELYASKVGTLVVAMTCTVVLTTVVTTIAAFLPDKHGGASFGVGDFGTVLWNAWLPAMVFGVIALGIGALVRATGGAIAVSLILQFAAAPLLFGALTLIDDQFKYVLINAAIDRLTSNTIHPGDDGYLQVPGAIICTLAWLSVFLVAGASRTQGSED